MMIWIDAQLSPSLAGWITQTFGIEAQAVRDLGFRDAKDSLIFQAARGANAIVLTKDSDFSRLLDQHGARTHLRAPMSLVVRIAKKHLFC